MLRLLLLCVDAPPGLILLLSQLQDPVEYLLVGTLVSHQVLELDRINRPHVHHPLLLASLYKRAIPLVIALSFDSFSIPYLQLRVAMIPFVAKLLVVELALGEVALLPRIIPQVASKARWQEIR